MRDLDYAAPKSLSEAVGLLSRANGSARPLAGGTDLIDQIRLGRHTPDLVIDLKKIPELNVWDVQSTGMRLGAAVPCCLVYENEIAQKSYSALVDSCRIIGGMQIQTRASVGGNLCNAGPAADTIPSLIALGASCLLTGPAGTRELPVEQFCTGPGKNVLQPGEIVVELKIPGPKKNSGSHYRRFIPRYEMDIAVVGVGASVVLNDSGDSIVSARIGIGAVAPTPLFAEEASKLLAGQKITDELLKRAGEAARSIARPIDDMRGTVEFRKQIVGVLVERVLRESIDRANGKGHFGLAHL